MKASLKIEAIGHNTYQYIRLWSSVLNAGAPGLGDLLGAPKTNYWVARIVGRDQKYCYEREFLSGKTDYRNANSIGSRGVFIYYLLESGQLYEVRHPVTWNRYRRYFCTVSDDGEIIEVSKELVEKWVNDRSESTCLTQPGNE